MVVIEVALVLIMLQHPLGRPSPSSDKAEQLVAVQQQTTNRHTVHDLKSQSTRGSAAADMGHELKLCAEKGSACHVSQVGRLGNLLKAEAMGKEFE